MLRPPVVPPEDAEKLHSSQAEGREDTASNTSEPLYSSQEDLEAEQHEYEPHRFEPLGETIYGAAIGAVIRDTIWMSIGTDSRSLRIASVLTSWLLVFLTLVIQWVILLAIGNLLVVRESEAEQALYDRFEVLMYFNHTTGPAGHRRGIASHFNREQFVNMDTGDKERICQIALAHPGYLFSILWLWSMSCMAEIRRVWDHSYDLLLNLRTIETFRREAVCGPATQELLCSRSGGGAPWDAGSHCDAERPIVVEGLTRPLKASIFLFCMVPRLVTVVVLLWLGCGVLTATEELKELLLNTTALEFVLLIKELMYHVIVPRTNRLNLERLKFKPIETAAPVVCCTYFSTVAWGALSVIWVELYMRRFQNVLPGYRWDVRPVCKFHGFDVKAFLFD